MNILLLTNTFPYPPNSGHRLRVYNLLKRIAKEHRCWLIAYTTPDEEDDGPGALKAFCQDVITIPKRDYGAFSRPLKIFQYLFSGIPPDIRLYHEEEAVKIIHGLLNEIDFDIIQIEDSYMAEYINDLPENMRAKTVLTLHDILFLKMKRMSHLEPKFPRRFRLWTQSLLMRKWEPNIAARFNLCVTMSDVDKEILKKSDHRIDAITVPNGVDTKLLQPLEESPGSKEILFVGNMGYRPNIDAMKYFCSQILPQIQKEEPEARLSIVGISPTTEILNLQSDSVLVTGKVEDLTPYYRRCVACVIPLRAGGGTRLKILEAMSLRRPVVSTTIGCEGINVTHEKNILIADEADTFTRYVLKLIRDVKLRQDLASAGRSLAEEQYDWDIIAINYLNELERISKRH